MTTQAGQTFNDLANPLAFHLERTEAEDTNPVFNNFANPCAYSAKDTTTAAEPVSSPSALNSRSLKLQRWNTVFRVLTCLFCLAAFIRTLVPKQTSSNVPLNTVITGRFTSTYNLNGSVVFFLCVNIVGCMYGLVLSTSAFVMGRKGTDQTTPSPLMWPAFILNVVTAGFLLLAIASALAVALVTNGGLSLDGNIWLPICKYFGTFCTLIDTALGFCALAFVSLIAGTCIDSIYLHKIHTVQSNTV